MNLRDAAKAFTFTARAIGNAGLTMAEVSKSMREVSKAFDRSVWDNEGDEQRVFNVVMPHRQFSSSRRADVGP